MKNKRNNSLIKIFFLSLGFFSLLFFTKNVDAAGDESIMFLHHSTGGNLYSVGGMASWFSDYNQNNGTSYQLNQRNYPTTPYPWNNYPYDYWNLWVNEACDSADPDIECLDTMTQDYDVIIYKHCYPGADISADIGSPNVGSSVKSLENYKLQYRALRGVMDSYPDTKFIIWTLVPLHRLATNSADAGRAKEFVDWVKNDFLTEDAQDHSNIYIFDFWGYVADNDNYLKYEYEISHTGSDSHPNTQANLDIGPIFSQFIVDTIENSGVILDTIPPSAPSGLGVE